MAALDGAWLAAALLGGLGASLALRVYVDCAVAMGSWLAMLRERTGS
jgi:hypothetical protein